MHLLCLAGVLLHSESKKQIYYFLFLQDEESPYNKIVFLDFHRLLRFPSSSTESSSGSRKVTFLLSWHSCCSSWLVTFISVRLAEVAFSSLGSKPVITMFDLAFLFKMQLPILILPDTISSTLCLSTLFVSTWITAVSNLAGNLPC